jgi:hypothetical protein
MLSTSAAWKEQMGKSGISPVYIVELHLSDSDVRYFSTTYIDLSDLSAPVLPNVSDVVGVSSSIDVESRSVSIGELHVHFIDDGTIREIVKDSYVYGKKLVVKLGCADFLQYSDYLNVGVGVVRDISPDEGEISLECTDTTILLRNKEVGPRYWLNGHPLEVILDILKASGMDASLYDATTLNWETDATRSHYLVSRYDLRINPHEGRFISNGVNDTGQGAGELINEVCELMWGSFSPDEDGIFRFKIYDETKAVDRNLLEGDCGSINQTTATDNLYNSISMNAGELARQIGRASSDDDKSKWGSHTEKSATIGFTKTDTTSQANHNYLGNNSGENDLEVTTNWSVGCSGISTGLKVDASDGQLKMQTLIPNRGLDPSAERTQVFADADGVVLKDCAYNGFSGSKFDLGTIAVASRVGKQVDYPHTFPVKTNRNISASRPSYLLIEGAATKWQSMATVKTQPTIGSTTIVVENVNTGFTVNQFIIFGSDYGPTVSGVQVGYRVTSWNSGTGQLGINTGILTAVAVETPVMEICGPTAANTEMVQWHTEIVKCISAFSWGYGYRYSSGIQGYGTPVYVHNELGTWPGDDGSLGPFASGQRLPKSGDIAVTAIGDCPTRAVEGDTYEWPYATLYNMRYPEQVVYRFEGTSTAINTNHFGQRGFGAPPSGRAQFGTETPWGWRFHTLDPTHNVITDGPVVPEGPDSMYHCLAWDITILVDAVSRRLDRFANGCPKVSIQTPIIHADIQLGDFVTITTDLYSAYSKNGADSDVVFEIVSKTVDALSDTPGCSFELAWVRNESSSYSPAYSFTPYVAQRAYNVHIREEVFETNSNNEDEAVLDNLGYPVTR